MIGVISKKHELEIVEEFFQLFKTPWEFYNENRSYDVVITTETEILEANAKLLVIYGSEKKQFDSREDIVIEPQCENVILDYDNMAVPIYGNISTFNEVGRPFMQMEGDSKVIGLEIEGSKQTILRIGYNLFQEVLFLLSSGQPPEYAHIPTLEIHISMLRNWILNYGIPLVEIPPVPAGYSFVTCLTHDVDFFRIRNHKFDHTILGFIYRALFGSFIDVLKGKTSWDKVVKNWKAVLLLPAVHLGIVRDFWVEFNQYVELEKGLVSTFFVIPFKNQAGESITGQTPKRRAARYDITDVKPEIQRLLSCGSEIGLHGIDAWQDSEKAREELNRISSTTGRPGIGVRMHWLYFNDRSPQILEKAGFLYDSTLGYNDAVGYRSGTTQAFRPLSAKTLLEVPLNIQDTALFYPKRMDLTESRALAWAEELINNAEAYGGVFTINWHHRSIAPERLWGDFYLRILEELKKRNVWFASVRGAVKWFSMRRAISFEEAEVTRNSARLRLMGQVPCQEPGLLLRIHRPNGAEPASAFSQNCKTRYLDLPLGNKTELKVSF